MIDVDYSNNILWEVIEVLDWSKWKHDQTDDKCGIFYGQDCDCGADEVNEMYIVAIEKLKTLLE